MKKKLFLSLLCSLTFCTFFFTPVYSMKSDSCLDDDRFSILLKIHNNDVQSNGQEKTLTIEEIFKLSEEELKEMSQEKLRSISAQVCTYVEKVMRTVTEDIEISLVNELKEYFETLGKLQKNTRTLIAPQTLISIIEKLPGVITSIESALKEVEKQIEEETQTDQREMPELYGDNVSTLKIKQGRLRCLLAVLKPSFVILVGGVFIGYSIGWLPANISESVQNYVVSTCKSWFL